MVFIIYITINHVVFNYCSGDIIIIITLVTPGHSIHDERPIVLGAIQTNVRHFLPQKTQNLNNRCQNGREGLEDELKNVAEKWKFVTMLNFTNDKHK